MNLSVGAPGVLCDIQSVCCCLCLYRLSHDISQELNCQTWLKPTAHTSAVLMLKHTHTHARKEEVKPRRCGYGMSQPCPFTPEEWCHTASTQECVTVTPTDRNTNTITGLCLLRNLSLFLQNKLEHTLKISVHLVVFFSWNGREFVVQSELEIYGSFFKGKSSEYNSCSTNLWWIYEVRTSFMLKVYKYLNLTIEKS